MIVFNLILIFFFEAYRSNINVLIELSSFQPPLFQMKNKGSYIKLDWTEREGNSNEMSITEPVPDL